MRLKVRIIIHQGGGGCRCARMRLKVRIIIYSGGEGRRYVRMRLKVRFLFTKVVKDEGVHGCF
jgi:hypothetical protein